MQGSVVDEEALFLTVAAASQSPTVAATRMQTPAVQEGRGCTATTNG